MSEFLQQLINGLSLGAIYALIALGYTMVYGVLRFINFAHSDVFMVGAFIGYYIGQKVPQNTLGGGLVVLLGAMLGCALLGMLIERLAYRPLRGAASLNPRAAQLVGVNNDVVISFTFGLGSALAGAGGILYAMNYPSIDPLMGVMPGLKAFVAAVLGGIGNIPGAALGGLLLGTVETFVNGSEWSTYKDAIAVAILIIILLFRPAGLMR